ncbi:MAG: hypothetical protein KGL39_41965 [Patescibacteria group bacterium]|nr:hypothetical protein [Patescibacteria group bacterium]
MGNDTNFVDQQTTVTAGWLNDVDDVVYRLLGSSTGPGGSAPTSAAEIVANLGAASLSTSNTYSSGASGTTQDFRSTTVEVSGAASGTAQPVQAQQLTNDLLPVHSTSGPGATSFALRNRLINGNFQINQRAYTSGTALTSGTYAHDRWKAGSGGCTYTFTQAANGQQITITAGSLVQVIENSNIDGGTYTLSWTGTAQGSVNGGAAAASPITVTGLAASTAVTVSFGTGTLGEVQFEPGPTATPFERRFYGLEKRLCQDYYSLVSFFWQGDSTSGNAYGGEAYLPTSMRATPTLAVLSQSNINGTFGTAIVAAEATDTERSVRVVASATSTTTGAAYQIKISASAEL